jgi:hypothetical protein
MVALVAWVAATHAAPLPGEPTLPTAQWKAIQRVIEDQLRALKAGDAAKAFSFASPGIRTQFETPDSFIAMVRSGYDALLVARYTEFLQGAVIDGRVIQPLRLVAPDNTVLVALYTMEKQKDGRWRIAGCVLAPSTVQAAHLGSGLNRRGTGVRGPSSPAASA